MNSNHGGRRDAVAPRAAARPAEAEPAHDAQQSRDASTFCQRESGGDARSFRRLARLRMPRRGVQAEARTVRARRNEAARCARIRASRPRNAPPCAAWARCAHRATRLSPCRRSHGPISRRFGGRPACAHFIHSPTNCTHRFSFSFAYRDKSSSIRAFRENIGLPITRIDRMMHWRDTRAAGDIARCRPAGCAADDPHRPDDAARVDNDTQRRRSTTRLE